MLHSSQKNSHLLLPWTWHKTNCPSEGGFGASGRLSRSLLRTVSTSSFDLKSSGSEDTVLPHSRRHVGHGNGRVLSFSVKVIKHLLQNECRHGRLFGSLKVSRQILHVVRFNSTSDAMSMLAALFWLKMGALVMTPLAVGADDVAADEESAREQDCWLEIFSLEDDEALIFLFE